MRIGKMTEQDLEPRILDLMGNQQFKTRARQIAAQMAKEDFREELLQALVGQSSVSHSGPVVPG
jgi:2-keto-3-deoxy-galactonokinase